MVYWKLRVCNKNGEIVDGNDMLPELTRKSLESICWSSVKKMDVLVKWCRSQMPEVNRIEKTIHSISINALKDTGGMVDMAETSLARIVLHQLLPLKKISMNYSDCLNKADFLNNLDNIDYYIASDKKEENFIGCRHGVIAFVWMTDSPIRHLSLNRQVTLVG